MTFDSEYAIIGGGATGLSAAVELASRGGNVTLFERDELGAGSTGRAAGICYDAYAQRRDARIATRSLARFRELDLLNETPYVWFARDEQTADVLESQARRMQEIGREVEILDNETLEQRFPALVTTDIETAAVARNAGCVEPADYVEMLFARVDRMGVEVVTGKTATVPEPGTVRVGATDREFDQILVAAGAGTPAVLEPLDCSLALGFYRTQAVKVNGPSEGVPIYYDATGEWYARPTGDGLIAGDGSHMYDGPPDTFEKAADDPFVEERLDELTARFRPDFSRRRSWAGLCTATPDRNPLLGSVVPGVYVVTGLCGHGFMRSPALAEIVVEEMSGQEGIPAFDPNRFDGDEKITLPVGITPE